MATDWEEVDDVEGERMRIGIVGTGVVGRALAAYYAESHDLWTVDKKDADYLVRMVELNANADVVFICVGTPYDRSHGHLDCSQVHAAVDVLTGEKTVIIKSTCMPGTTDAVQANHPEHKVFFVPEFLSEATALEDYAHPRRPHVVGITDSYTTVAFEDVIDRLLPYSRDVVRSNQHPVLLPAQQAELLKLATNSFYAMKVTFANELYDAGATQEMLDALGSDPWVGGEHFQVEHKGYRGYGGRCLPKDTMALANICLRWPLTTDLLWNLFDYVNANNYHRLKTQNIDVNKWL